MLGRPAKLRPASAPATSRPCTSSVALSRLPSASSGRHGPTRRCTSGSRAAPSAAQVAALQQHEVGLHELGRHVDVLQRDRLGRLITSASPPVARPRSPNAPPAAARSGATGTTAPATRRSILLFAFVLDQPALALGGLRGENQEVIEVGGEHRRGSGHRRGGPTAIRGRRRPPAAITHASASPHRTAVAASRVVKGGGRAKLRPKQPKQTTGLPARPDRPGVAVGRPRCRPRPWRPVAKRSGEVVRVRGRSRRARDPARGRR